LAETPTIPQNKKMKLIFPIVLALFLSTVFAGFMTVDISRRQTTIPVYASPLIDSDYFTATATVSSKEMQFGKAKHCLKQLAPRVAMTAVCPLFLLFAPAIFDMNQIMQNAPFSVLRSKSSLKYNDRSIKIFRESYKSKSIMDHDGYLTRLPNLKITIDFSDELRNGLMFDSGTIKLARNWHHFTINWIAYVFSNATEYEHKEMPRRRAEMQSRMEKHEINRARINTESESHMSINLNRNNQPLTAERPVIVLFGVFSRSETNKKWPITTNLFNLDVKFKKNRLFSNAQRDFDPQYLKSEYFPQIMNLIELDCNPYGRVIHDEYLKLVPKKIKESAVILRNDVSLRDPGCGNLLD
jgi:hypothetical protein